MLPARVISVFHNFNHLGYHVAAALYLDPVAHQQPEPLNEVGVVQRSAAHRYAAHKHRAQHGRGRKLAAAAHGNHDALKQRNRGLRGELVGGGPARRTAGIAEPLLCNV